jgi:hypothetical protein
MVRRIELIYFVCTILTIPLQLYAVSKSKILIVKLIFQKSTDDIRPWLQRFLTYESGPLSQIIPCSIFFPHLSVM